MDGFSDFDGRSWSYSLRNPDLIMPGLYLGPLSACDILSLQKHGITHILRVISNTDHTPPSEVRIILMRWDLPLNGSDSAPVPAGASYFNAFSLISHLRSP